MTLISPFYEWEQALAAGGQGPAAIYIDRGLPFSQVWGLGWDASASTFNGSLRLEPDAAGATLADFSLSVGTYDGIQTLVTVSLTSSQTAALPADDDGSGVKPIVFDILETPSGGVKGRLFGGVAYVRGKVTNA